MHADVKRLARVRLDANLTYKQLGDVVQIAPATLHQLIKRGATPNDRTLYRIQVYLSTLPKGRR